MNGYTWCAKVSDGQILFGRMDASDVDDATLKLIKHLSNYHIERLSVSGYRVLESPQMDVLS